MPETAALMVSTYSNQRPDTSRMRNQQRPASTANVSGKNASVQVSNLKIAESEPASPSDWQVLEVLAEYAGLAVRQESSGDLGTGLREELNELRQTRMAATTRLLEAD